MKLAFMQAIDSQSCESQNCKIYFFDLPSITHFKSQSICILVKVCKTTDLEGMLWNQTQVLMGSFIWSAL